MARDAPDAVINWGEFWYHDLGIGFWLFPVGLVVALVIRFIEVVLVIIGDQLG